MVPHIRWLDHEMMRVSLGRRGLVMHAVPEKLVAR